MRYLPFVFYYIYAIFVIAVFSYIVFHLKESGWWFILAVLLLNNSPNFRNNKND